MAGILQSLIATAEAGAKTIQYTAQTGEKIAETVKEVATTADKTVKLVNEGLNQGTGITKVSGELVQAGLASSKDILIGSTDTLVDGLENIKKINNSNTELIQSSMNFVKTIIDNSKDNTGILTSNTIGALNDNLTHLNSISHKLSEFTNSRLDNINKISNSSAKLLIDTPIKGVEWIGQKIQNRSKTNNNILNYSTNIIEMYKRNFITYFGYVLEPYKSILNGNILYAKELLNDINECTKNFFITTCSEKNPDKDLLNSIKKLQRDSDRATTGHLTIVNFNKEMQNIISSLDLQNATEESKKIDIIKNHIDSQLYRIFPIVTKTTIDEIDNLVERGDKLINELNAILFEKNKANAEIVKANAEIINNKNDNSNILVATATATPVPVPPPPPPNGGKRTRKNKRKSKNKRKKYTNRRKKLVKPSKSKK